MSGFVGCRKGLFTGGFHRYQNLLQGRESLKRTAAAFTVLLGLTAVMIGIYINEYSVLAQVLKEFVFLFP